MNKKNQILWIICLALFCLNIGYFAGNRVLAKFPKFKIFRFEQNKIDETIDLIRYNYVDTVDLNNLTENVVRKIVQELDPHSAYIPASEAETAGENLEVSFGGIGINFNMVSDTVVVVNVISGGPAEKAGLKSFDRIVSVDDSIIAGKRINQSNIMRILRGPRNSKVMLGILRGQAEELIQFELTRGDIPNYTVDVSFQVSDKIGYIKITRFARSTHNEFLTAVAKLRQEGVTGYIIDLRYNTGGFLDLAYYLSNEFLSKGDMIVYMYGNTYPRQEFRAQGNGICQQAPVVVLINEQSGSASEILAGAIQDNDRGLIIGRRSYGKGVVQQKLDLSDGSELWLTIARYYTPSGRCIQKEYELGKADEYRMDLDNRYWHGEFFTADSIKMNDSLAFKTAGGRTVYGGGGIMPDIFVPSDTTGYTSYYEQLYLSNALDHFILDYSNNHQDTLKQFSDYKALYEYLKGQPLIEELADYAALKGVRKRPTLMAISKDLIEEQMHALIVRNFFSYDGYYPIILKDDPMMLKAIEVIKKDIWKPELYNRYLEVNKDHLQIRTENLEETT